MKVPSSYQCVGEALFEREFGLELEQSERAFLCFDGVVYTATVSLNGAVLGDMLPYVPYRFDVTDHLTGGKNALSVVVRDITADFGPTGGWEDYGGICRDVYLEVGGIISLDTYQWLTRLDSDYAESECALRVQVANHSDSPDAVKVVTRLSLDGAEAFSGTQQFECGEDGGLVSFEFTVKNPSLWSPERPTLYDLDIDIITKQCTEHVREQVGIREFRTEGPRFLLNGEETFLKGVARHDMWGDGQGFTLTEEQVERDLLLIKRMGANFVRLVHYPHSRMTILAADRIGLMVSEEPGLWWSDMSNDEITGKALEIMRRTVLRDRNSPSVVAWLFFNECVLENATDYLKSGHALCKSLDPSRLVSGANCLDSKVAKEVFDECGFDFYTQHPYSYEPKVLVAAMEVMRGKPLVFTEWGGWYIHNNPNLLTWFKKTISRYAHNREPDPILAGMCWWQWQDIYQLSRGLPGCEEGLLSDGLVTADRERKPMYSVMSEFFDLIDFPVSDAPSVWLTGSRDAAVDASSRFTALDISALREEPEQQNAWKYAFEHVQKFERTPARMNMPNSGPLLPSPVGALGGIPVDLPEGLPLILAGQVRGIEIPVGSKATALHFYGHTTYFDGFPVRGDLGHPIGRYVVKYRDGSETVVQLRNGVETASASMIAINSRINPLASAAERVVVIAVDPDWEVYQINRFILPVDAKKKIISVLFESLDSEHYPLLYGITVEHSGAENG